MSHCIALDFGSLKMSNFDIYVKLSAFTAFLGDPKFRISHFGLLHCIALADYTWLIMVINCNNEVCSPSNNNVSRAFSKKKVLPRQWYFPLRVISKTRMHSSRMHTICNSGCLSGWGGVLGLLQGGLLLGGCLLLGGICSWGCLFQGMSAPRGCLLLGVSARGVVSAPRGVSALGCVSALRGCLLRGWCLLPGGSALGGCLLWGVGLLPGGCLLLGGGIPACTEADTPPWTDTCL